MAIPTQACDSCGILKPLECFPEGDIRCTECAKDEHLANTAIIAYKLQDTKMQLARATSCYLPLPEARDLFARLTIELGGVENIARSWADRIKESIHHKNPNIALRQFDKFLKNLMEFEKREREQTEVTELSDADIEREMRLLMANRIQGKITHVDSA